MKSFIKNKIKKDKKIRVNVSKVGIFYAIIMIFIGFAAINTANNLIYIISAFMFSFTIVGGALAHYNVKNIEIEYLGQKDIYATKKGKIKILIKSKKIIPTMFIGIVQDLEKEDETQNGKESFLEPTYLRFFKEEAIEIEAFFEKRGVYDNVRIKIFSEFPFGFVKRELTYNVKSNIYVFPKIEKCVSPYIAKEDESSKTKKASEEEFYTITDYNNESLRYINWKASAKQNKLLVNKYFSSQKEKIYLRKEDFNFEKEKTISCMAYLGLSLIKEGFEVGIIWDSRKIEPTQNQRKLLIFLTEL